MTATLRHISRIAIVAVSIAAWFSISNHCAVGALIAKTDSDVAPMHCHGNQPAPSKKNSQEEMPCCKVLRATLVQVANTLAADYFSTFAYQPAFADRVIFPERLYSLGSFELDTGPPFNGSFAELVLQRSILVHAPPLLA